MNLAQRSITSIAWNSVANAIKIVVFFGRSVLLSRWLPKQIFGVYATANLVVGLTVYFAVFGMGGAFVHRSRETEDEEHAAAIHFTLKLIFTAVWASALIAGALLFTQDYTRLAIILVTLTTAGVELTQTGSMILVRRVVHRRLALLQTVNALATTAVALTLGWLSLQEQPVAAFLAGIDPRDFALWALLGTDVATMCVFVFFLYVWRPVWRPQLAWSTQTVSYYLSFGSRNFLNQILLRALDHVDDLWTRLYLGNIPLADYSRAYTFATHPRRALAAPLNAVVGGTYAELKGNRLRLSRAFFRTNAFILRSAFFIGGLLALIAPEFIRLLLTEKWLTMLSAFRLMLIFTLLDPIRQTVAHLFIAVGVPEKVGVARFTQLIVLVAGLFVLGPAFDIAGVALAVDLMLIVGIAYLLWHAREYVDFSFRRLFIAPTIALLPALFAGYAASLHPAVAGSDWYTGAAKAITFTLLYGIILLLLEYKDLVDISRPYLITPIMTRIESRRSRRGST
ncbi:MAG: oligosaccharide flippase family protein [Candidatus Promineifilaceae bacterium]|nr:oligosaccharide flippase family protein [Candidatus Promineifilaceae bacterium]